MFELEEIQKILNEKVESGEITIDEANQAYDNMFEEVSSNVIDDLINAFESGLIDDDEYSMYSDILLEAVKSDKLDSNEKKKVEDEIAGIPEKEKKVIEDSIRKATKEANTSKNHKLEVDKRSKTIDGISKIIKSKKDVKESVDDFDLDKELALFESENL